MQINSDKARCEAMPLAEGVPKGIHSEALKDTLRYVSVIDFDISFRAGLSPLQEKAIARSIHLTL